MTNVYAQFLKHNSNKSSREKTQAFNGEKHKQTPNESKQIVRLSYQINQRNVIT